jgi:hypothetical protein
VIGNESRFFGRATKAPSSKGASASRVRSRFSARNSSTCFELEPRNFERAILIRSDVDLVIFDRDRGIVDREPISVVRTKRPRPPGQPGRTPPESWIPAGSGLTGLRARARFTAFRKLCPELSPPGRCTAIHQYLVSGVRK